MTAKREGIGLIAAMVAVIGVALGGIVAFQGSSTPPPKAETIYVQDNDSADWSRAAVKRDIPAWERAANGYFSKVWRSEKVDIKLLAPGQNAPKGSFVARIVKNGPVQGALAYHTVYRGVPSIVVYAGVGRFYGYSNSVSFTHELFEVLADPNISTINLGWPDPTIYVGQKAHHIVGIGNFAWINEVCDPVEAYEYTDHGVQISDWVTPNWFNDQVKGPIDYLGVLKHPQQVARGGYAQFFYLGGWFAVTNFRKHDANRGFFIAEADEHSIKVVNLDTAGRVELQGRNASREG